MMDFDVKPLPGGIGREIIGLEMGDVFAPQTAQALRAAWLEYGVLVFRKLGVSPQVQLRLSRCFGELEPHPIERFRLPECPDLILLSNEDGPSGPVYDFDGVGIYGRIPWHTDLAFATTPNSGAVLRMVRKTQTGGQTGWLDTALAYDALDEATRNEIEGVEARYLFRAGLEDMRFNKPAGTRIGTRNDNYPYFPPVANPVVWTHPETGRKILNISTLNIDSIIGMEESAGTRLIQRLIDHALDPRFQYIHEWENDDMVLWDNRRTMHCTMGHPVDQIRVVHRTTIKGSAQMGRVLEDQASEGVA